MKDFSEDIVAFLKEHPLISVHGLEKKAGMPKNSLTQAVAGTRKIPFDYIFRLFTEIGLYGFKDYSKIKNKEVWEELKKHSKPIDKEEFLKILAEKRAGKRK